ncbi:hypothetical protein [Petrachloros mirabilis]
MTLAELRKHLKRLVYDAEYRGKKAKRLVIQERNIGAARAYRTAIEWVELMEFEGCHEKDVMPSKS